MGKRKKQTKHSQPFGLSTTRKKITPLWTLSEKDEESLIDETEQ